MKIKYEVSRDGVLYTNCPNGKNQKVGSTLCEWCKYFKVDDEENQTVTCTYDKKENRE